MISQPHKNRSLANGLAIAFFLVLVSFTSAGFAQTADTTTEGATDFSNTNWEDDSTETPQDASGTGLEGINWDEEESPQTDATNLEGVNWDEENTSEGAAGIGWDEEGTSDTSEEATEVDPYAAEDAAALRTHLMGGSLFFAYLIGVFGTAFLLRKSAMAYSLAPEFLIILHAVWPLEWIASLFFRNRD